MSLTARGIMCKYSHYEYSLIDLMPRAFRDLARQSLSSQSGFSLNSSTNRRGFKSRVIAIFLFFAVIADNLVERFRQIEPFARSYVIIYDRYFYDHLIRSTHGWPTWLTGVYLLTVPTPNLTIFLDVPATVANQRKPEVAFAVASTQRNLYLRLAQSNIVGKVLLVDACASREEVDRVILSHTGALAVSS